MADDVKPRFRVQAHSTPAYTVDSFQNVNQRIGRGAGTPMDSASYNFSYIGRNRTILEAAYRTSWIVGKAVDAPAEDMTKAGIVLHSNMKPEDEAAVYAAYRDLLIGQEIANAIRWSRLYGGAIAVMMIDGQDMSTPLRLDTITQGKFKGLWVLDRWVAQPDMSRIIKTLGPDFGLPEYYFVGSDQAQGITDRKEIHYSRVLRFTGIPLPYYQRSQEMLWGESVVERIWDRILAFDSTTSGAAQLVFKAHLRTIRVKGYRSAVAAGGPFFEGVMAQFENMRMFQNIEGLTVLDAEDEFETHSYNFAGIDDVLTQMGNQICGGLEIPRVRMFGESPGGLGSNGDGELRTYYDETGKKQETHLRRPTGLVLDVLCRSVTGKPPPPGFTFGFAPLWQMSDKEKAEIAKTTGEAVSGAYGQSLLTQKAGMQELKNSSRITGIFSNITDQDIAAAEDVIPDPVETAKEMAEATNVGEGGEGDDASAPGATTAKD